MFAKPNRLYLISIATIFLVFGIYTLSSPKFAIAQSNTTNGVCVGALNFARKGQLPQDGTTTSISYRLDYNFSSSTASLEALSTNSDSTAAKKFTTNTSIGTASFAITNGLITGSYLLTPTGTNANNFPSFYLLPAASATTFFIQVKNDDTTGICVKV